MPPAHTYAGMTCCRPMQLSGKWGILPGGEGKPYIPTYYNSISSSRKFPLDVLRSISKVAWPRASPAWSCLASRRSIRANGPCSGTTGGRRWSGTGLRGRLMLWSCLGYQHYHSLLLLYVLPLLTSIILTQLILMLQAIPVAYPRGAPDAAPRRPARVPGGPGGGRGKEGHARAVLNVWE